LRKPVSDTDFAEFDAKFEDVATKPVSDTGFVATKSPPEGGL